MLICPCCAVSSFQTLKKLLRHIRLSHSDQENFTIDCKFQGCNRTFRKLRSFENHIYAYHDVNTVGQNCATDIGTVDQENDYEDVDDDDNEEAEVGSEESDQVQGW